MPDDANETAHRNGNGGIRAGEAIKHAREILADVLGKSAESVSGVNRSEEGWSVALDVVELSRIPPSTDVLIWIRSPRLASSASYAAPLLLSPSM